MGLVAAVRDIEAYLVSAPEEQYMRLLDWAGDEVLITMVDNIKAETSTIHHFPSGMRWWGRPSATSSSP